MDQLIFHNDRIIPLDQARLSPGQMGLLMGWGTFTTLRIYRGIPFEFERHWARLTHDAARLHVNLCYTQEGVRQAIIELAKANQRPEGMARVSFVKNKGGLWAQADDRVDTDLIVFTRELVRWPAAHRLKLQPMGVFSSGDYAGAKVLSWVRNADVLERAHAEGYDDALLLNEKGQLAECTSANLFLVRGKKVLTPPLSSGCLPGITRQVVLEIAPQAGVEGEEQDLYPEDLSRCDEVFISSTTREVAAVGCIDPNWKYPAPGKVSLTLEEVFQKHVQHYLDQARTGC
ncbi:MAG TPA: aminotransferase class IV [Terriglobia bacterium]|jgi:branched-chain amino acid aminotransferase|nr:aminotransferase class IV [Terriglobia bacterium]